MATRTNLNPSPSTINRTGTSTPMRRAPASPAAWKLVKNLQVPGTACQYRILGKRVLLQTCNERGLPITVGGVPPTIVLSLDQFKAIAKDVTKRDEELRVAAMRAETDRLMVANAEYMASKQKPR